LARKLILLVPALLAAALRTARHKVFIIIIIAIIASPSA
jgi:hypothetical protein